MNTITTNPIFSWPDVIKSKEPRETLKNKLVSVLSVHLKDLKIVWSAKAFKGGLNNPDLPVSLLKVVKTLRRFIKTPNAWR